MGTARFIDQLAAKLLRFLQHLLHLSRAARVDVDQPLKRCPQAGRLVPSSKPLGGLRPSSIVMHRPTFPHLMLR
jgi:hypothetical protein